MNVHPLFLFFRETHSAASELFSKRIQLSKVFIKRCIHLIYSKRNIPALLRDDRILSIFRRRCDFMKQKSLSKRKQDTSFDDRYLNTG